MNYRTPHFRVNFPSVLKPSLNKQSGVEEYSLVALFPKGTDLEPLKKIIHECIVKKWGADQNRWPANLHIPLRKQEERGKMADGKFVLPKGYEEGAYFANLKTKRKPVVVDQAVKQITDDTEFYSGCWAHADIYVMAFEMPMKKGVSLRLNQIQKVKEGEPLGGRMAVEDAFTPIATDMPVTNSTDLFK